MAIEIHWEGRRCVLTVELARRECATSGKVLLKGLRAGRLRGGRLVASDDAAGLKRAVREGPGEALWQRSYVHLLRNALDDLPQGATTTVRPGCAGSTSGGRPPRRNTI